MRLLLACPLVASAVAVASKRIPLAQCQESLSGGSPEGDIQCAADCKFYLETVPDECKGDVASSGDDLIRCVLEYQSHRCKNMRDPVTVCQKALGPNSDGPDAQCFAHCRWYYVNPEYCGDSGNVTTDGDDLIRCVLENQLSDCRDLRVLTACQDALGLHSEEANARCDKDCAYYFDHYDLCPGEVRTDAEALIDCLLDLQGDHCQDLRPMQECQHIMGSKNEEEACDGICQYYFDNAAYCRGNVVHNTEDLITCTKRYQDCGCTDRRALWACQAAIGSDTAEGTARCANDCKYYFETANNCDGDVTTDAEALITCTLLDKPIHCQDLRAK